MKLFNQNIISSTLLKNTAIYTLTTIINSAIPFLLIPILTRYLNPSDYGIISVYTVIVAIVSPFIVIMYIVISPKYIILMKDLIWVFI